MSVAAGCSSLQLGARAVAAAAQLMHEIGSMLRKSGPFWNYSASCGQQPEAWHKPFSARGQKL